VITTTNLLAAHSILTSYSDGVLPMPSYVAVGQGSITFVMDTPEDVTRWAQSADVSVNDRTSYDDDGSSNRIASCDFKHGDLYVSVVNSVKTGESQTV
jgi:hypothetical protein